MNVLFSDQWELWTPLFRGDGLWTLWRWQHGPQRQGLGSWVMAATAWASGWDARAEGFVAAGIVILATALALALARRLRGAWAWTDAIIPVVMLTLSQYEAIVLTPNVSHGPLPLLLAVLLAWAVQVQDPHARILLAATVTFVATQTGFGIFLGAAGVALLALFVVEAVRARRHRAVAVAGLALGVSSFALLLHGFVMTTAVADYATPTPAQYLAFVGMLFAKALGGWAPWLAWPGLAVFALAVGLALWGAWRLLRAGGEDRLAGVALVLAGFSGLFALGTAAGRAYEFKGAYSSRYVTYAIPLFLAAYLFASIRLPPSRLRALALLAFCAVMVRREWSNDLDVMIAAQWSAAKRQFRHCYLTEGDLARCTQGTWIHPDPAAAQVAEKLRYLRDHHLGMYARTCRTTQ